MQSPKPFSSPPPATANPPDARTPDTRRWGRIPAWWLDQPGLDADGFAVLAALATFADEDGLCWPSQSTLAAKLKRSRPTINRIIQGLGDLGLIRVEHRRGRDGARLSCLYRLRFTPLDEEGAPAVATTAVTATPRPVPAADRDDSQTHTPCPPPSQEQVHFKQIPDSLAKGGRKAAREVPADWMPNADDLAWAAACHAGIDLGRHVEGFILRCQAHGYRYRDISAAWRAWLSQDAAAGKAPVDRNRQSAALAPVASRQEAPRFARQAMPSGACATELRLGAWAAAAAELRHRAAARVDARADAAPSWS